MLDAKDVLEGDGGGGYSVRVDVVGVFEGNDESHPLL